MIFKVLDSTVLPTKKRAREHTFSLARQVGKDLHCPPMEMVPLDTQEPMEDNSYLSERAIFARDKEIERKLRRPGLKQSLLEKYREALDLIGGVPRLAIMADEDPQRFMDQMIALEKSAQVKKVDHSVRFLRPALPPSPLDGEITDADFEEVAPDAVAAVVSPQKD